MLLNLAEDLRDVRLYVPRVDLMLPLTEDVVPGFLPSPVDAISGLVREMALSSRVALDSLQTSQRVTNYRIVIPVVRFALGRLVIVRRNEPQVEFLADPGTKKNPGLSPNIPEPAAQGSDVTRSS